MSELLAANKQIMIKNLFIFGNGIHISCRTAKKDITMRKLLGFYYC